MSGECGGCRFLVEAHWDRCKFCGYDLSAPPPPPLPSASSPPTATASGGDGLGMRGLRLPGGGGKKKYVLGALVVFVIYGGVMHWVAGEPWTETNRHGVEEMSGRAMEAVCEDGQGAKGTASYEPGPERHPMHVAGNVGKGWSSIRPPYVEGNDRAYEGQPASEIELVGCYRAVPNPPTTFCRFEDGVRAHVEHYRVMAEVRVASTGELLDERLVAPRREECPLAILLRDDEPQTAMYPTAELRDYFADFTN